MIFSSALAITTWDSSVRFGVPACRALLAGWLLRLGRVQPAVELLGHVQQSLKALGARLRLAKQEQAAQVLRRAEAERGAVAVQAWLEQGRTLDRALTDDYGIGEESVPTGPLGQRVLNKLADSVGSWHVGLSPEPIARGGRWWRRQQQRRKLRVAFVVAVGIEEQAMSFITGDIVVPTGLLNRARRQRRVPRQAIAHRAGHAR